MKRLRRKIASAAAAMGASGTRFLARRSGVTGRVGRYLLGELDLDYLRSRLVNEEQRIGMIRGEGRVASDLKISIVTPSYNIPLPYIKEYIDSLRRQTYSHWELCICDDADPIPEVTAYWRQLASDEPEHFKLTIHAENQGISQATLNALDLATGDVVGFVDADDLLHACCFELVVQRFVSDPEIDIVYTDHDHCTNLGIRTKPARKPGWSPELLLNLNYINHFLAVRRSCLDRCAGAFGPNTSGAQDWDFCFRLAKHARRASHIAVPLYHWRMRPGSVASGPTEKPWAFKAAGRVRQERIEDLHPFLTIGEPDSAYSFPAPTVRPEVSAAKRPPLHIIYLGKPSKFDVSGYGQPASIDAIDDTSPSATTEKLRQLISDKDGFALFIQAAEGELSGNIESSIAYVLMPNIGCVYPFRNTKRQVFTPTFENNEFVSVENLRSNYSSSSGNVLTGSINGMVIGMELLRECLDAIDEFGGLEGETHVLGVALGMVCITKGKRNVATDTLQVSASGEITPVRLPDQLIPEIDPYI